LDLFLECALFFAGLAFGSFLNVCISRIPRDLSVVSPSSFCPQCKKRILWRDNIPLLSWILLRGRCRECGKSISLRYPAVELLTAALFVGCYISFGTTWLMLKACLFCFLTVGLIFMDAETGLLVHEFTYPGIVLGLGFSWLAPTDSAGTELLLRAYQIHFPSGRQLSLIDSALGALVGAGFFYLAWALYYVIRKRHGIGFGDIALMAMSGAFLGLKLTLLAIFFAPLLAVVYAICLLARHRRREPVGGSPADVADSSSGREMIVNREIQFGVFLGACSLVAVFLGETIWRWYLGFFR